MKILSISNVITNSSSEVFIIETKELSKLSSEVKKNFEVINEQNLIEKLLNYDLDNIIITLGLPEFLTDSDFIEGIRESRKIHTDKEIIDVLYPMFKDIIDIAVFIQEDNYNYGVELINFVSEELNKKEIEYTHGRE